MCHLATVPEYVLHHGEPDQRILQPQKDEPPERKLHEVGEIVDLVEAVAGHLLLKLWCGGYHGESWGS